MAKERRLGRGLAALLGEPDVAETNEASELPSGPPLPKIHQPADLLEEAPDERAAEDASDVDAQSRERLIELDVHEIDENPFQPRREFGSSEIASLSESLKEHDMLQPVLVRRQGDRWQLISGERRLRAAIQAGWKRVPARVKDADDRLVAELAIVENLQRKDLNPIEKALSFQRYLREHSCRQEDLARRLKIDRSTIANLLRLLELPELVQDALRSGTISNGHARALLPLGEEREQIDFCNRIRREGLSVRDTERYVQDRLRREGEGNAWGRGKKRNKSDQVAALEQAIRSALGAKVEIRQGSGEKGKLIIHFHSTAEFERIRSLLAG